MQLDALLEVAVGLVFTWLVLSVATVQAQDSIGRLLNWRANFLEQSIGHISIGRLLNWRANFLEQSIGHMLKNPHLVTELYNEPLIEALGE
ncbi:MAG TPA: hypothetical protein VFD54_12750, partial [Anaerolineales bacterium]|nr:hypothetical protein [Anaerolineales bacterium]